MVHLTVLNIPTTKHPKNAYSDADKMGRSWKGFCLKILGCILKPLIKTITALSSSHDISASFLNDLGGFHKYTTVHLKYQMLIHLRENLPNTELMKQILTKHGTKLCVSMHALKLRYSSFYTLSNGEMPNSCWVL